MAGFDGAFIKGEELNRLKEEALANVALENVLEGVQRYHPVTVNDLEVDFAYKSDMQTPDNKLVTRIQINFVNPEKNATIVFNRIEGYPLSIDKTSFALVVDTANDELTAVELNTVGEVITKVVDDIYQEPQVPEFEENLPDNEDYIVKEYDENAIEPLAWWNKDGCLPGGYQHCGGNCGYGHRDHGGGSPINDTDRCCVKHDACYVYNGKANCTCDEELVRCVVGHTTNAAVGIRLIFHGC